jgi:coenzyme F420 hydrogenase subunit alpha
MPVVEKAIEGYHHKYAEVIMRAYDIWASCATHIIVKDEQTKKVVDLRRF